jgi:hypothetical protein
MLDFDFKFLFHGKLSYALYSSDFCHPQFDLYNIAKKQDPFAIVKPAMHSIIDHFWAYVGNLGAMAAEALESQSKDFRFSLSQLEYREDIQRALDDAIKSMLLSTSEVLNETMATKLTMVHHCSNCGSSLYRVNKWYLNCSNCHSQQHKSNTCDLT